MGLRYIFVSLRLKIGAGTGHFKIYLEIVLGVMTGGRECTCAPDARARMIRRGALHSEEEMMTQPKTEKPAPKGPVGLWIYSLLTILGGLALVFIAE